MSLQEVIKLSKESKYYEDLYDIFWKLYKDDKIIPHDSLINFKEQFGAQAMIRKVMKLNL